MWDDMGKFILSIYFIQLQFVIQNAVNTHTNKILYDGTIHGSNKKSFQNIKSIPICDRRTAQHYYEQMFFGETNSGINLHNYKLAYKFSPTLSSYTSVVSIKFGINDFNGVRRIFLNSNHNHIHKLILETDLNFDQIMKNETIKPDIMNVCMSEKHLDTLIIDFTEKLLIYKMYMLSIHFNGTVTNNLKGIYKSEYNQTDTVIITILKPRYARYVFPCFDDPKMKANISLSLHHASSFKSYSNMPISRIYKYTNGEKLVTFEESPPMSVYLFTFTINTYSMISRTYYNGNNVSVSVLLPTVLVNKGKFALDIAIKALNIIENLTKTPYPLKKLDLIGVPELDSEAIEGWGLITLRMSRLYYDSEIVSNNVMEQIVKTIVHVISHQWFGNYVTTKYWKDIWLNEGFATFITNYVVDKLFPIWDIILDDRLIYVNDLIDFDYVGALGPIFDRIHNDNNLSSEIDLIMNNKAAIIIGMVVDFVGDNAFWEVIRKYLNTFAYSSITTNELLHLFRQEFKTSYIDEMILTWLQNSGIPLVTVNLSNNKNESHIVNIKQERIIHTTKKSVFSATERWIIPISYTIQYTNDTSIHKGYFWLDHQSQTFLMESEIKWIKINNLATGYYISQYNNVALNMLLELFEKRSKELSPIDITYIHNCLRRRTHSHIAKRILKFISIIHYDIFYVNMNTVYSAAKYYRHTGDVYKSLNEITDKSYGMVILETKYKYRHRITYQNALNEKLTYFGSPIFKRVALRVFQSWLYNTNKRIAKEFLPHALRATAMYGNLTDIQQLEKQYIHTDNPYIRRMIMLALTQVQNMDYIKRYVTMCINSNFFSNQDFEIFLALLIFDPLRANVFSFIKETNETMIVERLCKSTHPLIKQLCILHISNKSRSVDTDRNNYNHNKELRELLYGLMLSREI